LRPDARRVQQAPGLFRTDQQHHDLSVPRHEVIQNRVDIGPEAPFVRHEHPGEEIIYILEGTLEYAIRRPCRGGALDGAAVLSERCA
jgi:quercetin dioxygenase-like cupin family protein